MINIHKCLSFFCYPKYIINYISKYFIVYSNFTNISNEIITIKNRNTIFFGFTVINSNTEVNRKAIYWFYKNTISPNFQDWLNFLKEFNIPSVPYHELIFHTKEYDNKIHCVKVFEINSQYINYSYDDINISIPLGISILSPEKYIYNHQIYNMINKV